MRRKRVSLRGLVSGRLVVLAKSDRVSSSNWYWWCICRCGKRKEVRDTLLTTGKTKSCGCLSKELASKRSLKYGKGQTPEAAVWRSMIARCHHPQNAAYKYYGGRGIQVCQRWRDSFDNFLADMSKPFPGAHIDRINNDLGYSPENCRWATVKENQRNRSDNVRLTFHGETKTLAEWAEIKKLPYGTLWSRIFTRKWSTDRALVTPVNNKKCVVKEC